MTGKSRLALMRELQELFFTLDDLKLYLDTHPMDRQALDYYRKIRNMKDKAVEEYTRRFGPLRAEDVDVDCYWTWVETPWPWERQV